MVTDMPKPDLLCLVQLLDGTIETFRVSVRNTHKHTHSLSHCFFSVFEEIMCCSDLSLCSANDPNVMCDVVPDYIFLFPLIHISRTTPQPCLKDKLTSCSL